MHTSSIPEAERLLSLVQTARLLGVCRRTLERLIAAGEFPPPAKVGSKSMFFPSDVKDYFEKLRTKRGA